MASDTTLLYSLLTLDLKDAESYRDGFYTFLNSAGWNKREEADTAWTQILTVPDTSVDDVARTFSVEFNKKFVSYLNDQWGEEHGDLPPSMNVMGIMQIGDMGYFSVRFEMNRKKLEAGATVKYVS
ncbi:hypothetical protein [Desulfovibrio sp. 86]|uniref:Uncharacterized protein n=1 Tax=uncultured Desulfovibrio sp. TaxID=167968 RepID=A0A212KX87_9BACT|nr:hypothetical protein [Desulfovibrio sp. 86]SCM69908.1 hypothetical protein KL86DES1_10031 [uncultured Desulfovibrio sp.]VZH35243.1 conserved protein of unknown function [Desulfovibrio sp. 86]